VMQWYWQRMKGAAGTRAPAARPDSRRRTRLTLESLEDRLVPSLMGSASAVHAPPPGNTQAVSANASSLSGHRSVIVFTQADLAGQHKAIFAQVYDANGNRILPFGGILGGALDNLPVDTDSPRMDPNTNIIHHVQIGNPAVAMDPTGDFVVTW